LKLTKYNIKLNDSNALGDFLKLYQVEVSVGRAGVCAHYEIVLTQYQPLANSD